MNIKDRVKFLADQRGISLPNLEKALGFGSGTIVKWDKQNPGVDRLIKVANYFGVSLDYLAGRETGNTPQIKDPSTIELIARDKRSVTKKDIEKMQRLLNVVYDGEWSVKYGSDNDKNENS